MADCPICGRVLNRSFCPVHGYVTGDGVGGGVVTPPSPTSTTDHGSLSGLADDDHTSYLNDSRHASADHSFSWSGSSGNTLTVSDTEPSDPEVGDLWVDTSAL